jgi:hypothetical protein
MSTLTGLAIAFSIRITSPSYLAAN